MFQTFEVTSRPEQGPPRLAALRAEMVAEGVDGFIVPRADAWQGEYVADCDDRLAWLTGFTGSAGYAVILAETAGVLVDGRYRVQVNQQVADVYTPVDWPEITLPEWIAQNAKAGSVIGYDPWLHPVKAVRALTKVLKANGMALRPVQNLVDSVWSDRPARPTGLAFDHPIELAGETSKAKRTRLAQTLRDAGETAVIITLPDSICWLLNIRGSDIPRIPVVQCFAILYEDARVSLFVEPEKAQPLNLDKDVEICAPDTLLSAIGGLSDRVRIDPEFCPQAVMEALSADPSEAPDPCLIPKACKTEAELSGARAAHDRDAVAMVEFLAWLEASDPNDLTEIDVVRALEGFRRETNALRDISFETISGAGPNGAIVHYRVSEETNRTLATGELLLVDSGGQYVDGTTDITRTIALGPAPEDARFAFTRVLKGMIDLSRIRFPKGIAGSHLDTIARAPLWRAGQDYDHGTGHGVGSYLSVHEGPARISRASDLPLKAGMILSNEPGYYREGAFGIRIENLIVVEEAPTLPGADARDMLSFETLTYVPIDLSLIDPDLLGSEARKWLNDYHEECAARLSGRLTPRAEGWIARATRAI